jgi:SAM-dependent methyltransferase
MMPELPSIYDAAFFREWGPGNEKYVQSARLIADLLWDVYRPASVIDLGCGCGVYADAFRRKGARVVAVDGVRPPSEHTFPGEVQVRDLTAPFDNPWGPFDLALCLEVAEHIPEPLSDAFLANITRFSPRLVLSAAQPGQGGHHHVNEQPKRYWVEKLARHRFAYRRPATGRLQEAFKTTSKLPLMWMGEHVSVYERMEDGFPLKEDLPFGARAPAPPPGDLHA